MGFGKTRKRSCMITHCKKRARERYGKIYSESDFKAIESLIKQGLSTPVNDEGCTNRISKHIVQYDNILIKVAYDKTRHSLASILDL